MQIFPEKLIAYLWILMRTLKVDGKLWKNKYKCISIFILPLRSAKMNWMYTLLLERISDNVAAKLVWFGPLYPQKVPKILVPVAIIDYRYGQCRSIKFLNILKI